MTEFWEAAFSKMQLAWGLEPTQSAAFACDIFARAAAKDVLIPGIGYGRNARPFLERGMSVEGIEISGTAIELCRSRLGLEIPIVHGSVADMPFDDRTYDGIFCFGLVYLLDAHGRQKLIRDCYGQLKPGGHMVFTVISKKAPMYGQGPRLGEDWYERLPGLPMYFYDQDSVKREFGAYDVVDIQKLTNRRAVTRPYPSSMSSVGVRAHGELDRRGGHAAGGAGHACEIWLASEQGLVCDDR